MPFTHLCRQPRVLQLVRAPAARTAARSQPRLVARAQQQDAGVLLGRGDGGCGWVVVWYCRCCVCVRSCLRSCLADVLTPRPQNRQPLLNPTNRTPTANVKQQEPSGGGGGGGQQPEDDEGDIKFLGLSFSKDDVVTIAAALLISYGIRV